MVGLPSCPIHVPTVGLLNACVFVSAGFIYADWTDKVRPLNDTKIANIDLTKYYIQSSSHRYGGSNCIAESSAHMNHGNNVSSASFAALDSSHLDEQVSARLHCVADSVPNISVSYDSHAHHNRSAHRRRRSSAHAEVRHSDRRGHAVRGPPTADSRPVAVSDLNLTNSMTSLVNSGSTSSRAWPALWTPGAVSAQAGARKPPTGNHRVPATKRTTPRLQSDDHRTPAASNNNHVPVLRRPMSVDALSRADATPLRVPGPSIDVQRRQLRSALSSPFPPHDGAREHLSSMPVIPRPPADRPVRRPLSAALTSMCGDQNRVRCGPLSPPGGVGPRVKGSPVASPAPPVASAVPAEGPALQERRKICVSHTDVRCVSPTSPAAGGISHDCRRNAAIRPGLCSQPRLGVNMLGRNPKLGIQRGKTASLADVASGRRLSDSVAAESCSVVGRAEAVWSPRDVTNMAETAVGVAGGDDSLSDEGYQTKDSGSTTSLNRAQFIRVRRQLLSAYL